jgi:hypothetical protein
MHFPIHKVRTWGGAVFSLGPALALFLMVQQPSSRESLGASVSGRVTYEGRPVTGMMICFRAPDRPNTSYSVLGPDGSFSLQTHRPGDGAAPGKYLAHFETTPGGTPLPSKFFDPDSRELQVEFTRGWNHCQIDLK